jgi:hypothetical protein
MPSNMNYPVFYSAAREDRVERPVRKGDRLGILVLVLVLVLVVD